MYRYFKIFSIAVISLFLFSTIQAFSGDGISHLLEFPETDTSEDKLLAFFDLRDRETYIQITNTGNDLRTDSDDDDEDDRSGDNITLHIQIFNVDDNCNENNFFDVYTPADTHIYNMRDILTNDGTPSGVVLPENAYGIVSVGIIQADGTGFSEGAELLIGNVRILDDTGYEYRTNITSDNTSGGFEGFDGDPFAQEVTFNFNTVAGVTLSDVVGINYTKPGGDDDDDGEIAAADILDINTGWSVDIFNNNEVPQSCRNIIFACVDQDNPLLEELLEEVAGDDDDDFGANVASFEYGINNAIPHSRGSELLCPGNITSEGFVNMRLETRTNDREGDDISFIGYIGLNNGNGRGSFDSFWYQNALYCSTQETCQNGGQG